MMIFSIIVVDDKGEEVVFIDVVIVFCFGCNDYGICDYNIMWMFISDMFKYVVCNCIIGYLGLFF